MSTPPKRQTPQRRVSSGQPRDGYDGNRAPRSGGGGRQAPSNYRQPAPRRQVYYEPPPKRDIFPIVMGGIIGALVMGLMIVIFLITSNNNSTTAVTPPPSGGTVPTQAGSSAAPQEPDRISLADFKKLYDDTANRPMIVDVRGKQPFDEGHITGSVNIPLAETDVRIAEYPKDKLIVAYCQWPAENESASLARKLLNEYGYSKQNVKVLLGGWSAWKAESANNPTGYPITINTAAPSTDNPPGVVIMTPAP